MPIRLDKDTSEQKILDKCKEKKYELTKPFILNDGNKSRIFLKCEYGHTWDSSYNNFICKNRGCKKCSIIKVSQSRKRKQDIANMMVENKCVEKNYTLLKPFIYIDSNKTRLEIKCNICGHIWTPIYHKFVDCGDGCKMCGIKNTTLKKRGTTENFIIKAKKVHGDKYDYSMVEYVDANKKIKIICKDCGVFEQKPYNHLTGYGCYKCYGRNKTTEEFIAKAKKVHGNKYNYEKTNYVNSTKNVTIICKIHGEFSQNPSTHLCGSGCFECGGKKPSTTELFIEKAKMIHGDKYDYSLVNYTNSRKHVTIICKKHGEFKQQPIKHVGDGNGCPLCGESKGEIKIKNYLDKLNVEYIREMKFDGCKGARNRLRFDYYIPKINTCIEFDGKQHYESINYYGGEDGLKRTQTNDQIKNKYCLDNNIRLIRIRYDESIEERLKEIFE